MTEAREFFVDLLVKYYKKRLPGSKIEDWEKKQTIEYKLQNGSTIKITVAQAMNLHVLAKRAQSGGHLMQGGIVLIDPKRSTFSEAFKGKKATMSIRYTLSYEDIEGIRSELTDEQKRIADEIQRFVGGRGSELGNEASMKMYGYRKFTEKNYWPLISAEYWLQT